MYQVGPWRRDGTRLLQELYEQNSFLIPLDDQGTWFRHHHLFRDYLRKQLGKTLTLKYLLYREKVNPLGESNSRNSL
ncbi:hypothetical protein [Desulfosporosinus acidiphilus]|uniref:hypothetical protein n=1 Tax=Desulfosporosinus acidiphilus TaxID=885581 RepID=UPI0003133CA2|nr:hypothetical protein [Desulfosporosinus acidiphilus]